MGQPRLPDTAGRGWQQPIAPRLYGADRVAGLLVMEDLGQGQSLVQPLLGNDRAAAEAALDAYSAHLAGWARAHARCAEYWEIRGALGPPHPYAQPTIDRRRAGLERWLTAM